jgi:hypothetical protein
MTPTHAADRVEFRQSGRRCAQTAMIMARSRGRRISNRVGVRLLAAFLGEAEYVA